MTNIAILGLDTSHGEAFAEVLESLDPSEGVSEPSVTAIWDDGTVRDDEYVDGFCEKYAATRYDEPSDLVGEVDAAMVLAVDWDRHVSLAEPFLEAGIPTLVDKPIAGTLSDLSRLSDAAGEAPLFGGSAVPYHPSFSTLPASAPNRTLHLAGYHDYFYYRVHMVDTVRRVVDADWAEVTPAAGTTTSTVQVSFDDGTWATLRFDGTTDEGVFAALDVADRTRTVEIGSSEAALREMYEPYLQTFLEVVHENVDSPTEVTLDAARLLFAVEVALAEDREVVAGDPALEEVVRPATAFVEDYEPYY